MAANYSLVSSSSTVQVLSPTVTLDVVVATIQTQPSGVIANITIPRSEWDAGQAAPALTGYAANIEQVMQSPEVVGASSGRSLDTSGLMQSDLIFTVGYAPPGSKFPPATVDVTVPASQLYPSLLGLNDSGVQATLATIDTAYKQLVTAAGGVTKPKTTADTSSS